MTGGKALVPVKTIGRPRGTVVYGPDCEDEIIERMEDGHTVTSIARTDVYGAARQPGTFPTQARIYDWADPTSGSAFRPAFALRFARARLAQHQTWVEETVDIANNQEIGYEEVAEHSAKNGVSIRRARKDMLHHRVLKIETRLKAVQKMDPKRWQDRLQQIAPSEDSQANEPDRIIIEGGLPDDPAG